MPVVKNTNEGYSRRQILQISSWLPLLFLIPSFLSSCKKKNNTLPPDNKPQNNNCNTSNLSENEKNIRQALKYVDKTPLPSRTCDNCKLYTKPINQNTCGGCQIIPGPIEPKGYCVSWVALM